MGMLPIMWTRFHEIRDRVLVYCTDTRAGDNGEYGIDQYCEGADGNTGRCGNAQTPPWLSA